MTIEAGTKLGRYEIRSKLGAGGMGEVYLARDTQLDRLVAVKILPAQIALDQQRLHRFLQEARAAAALSHPNIAHIYEIGASEGAQFIAMEYVEGTPLDKNWPPDANWGTARHRDSDCRCTRRSARARHRASRH